MQAKVVGHRQRVFPAGRVALEQAVGQPGRVAGAPLYAPHFLTTAPWGFRPLEDQQLAGLIMWVPAAGLYLAAALVLTNRWLGRERCVAAA